MKVQVELCLGSSCFARGNNRILTYLEQYIDEEGVAGQVTVTGHLCMGNCSSGPVVRVNGTDYFDLNEKEMITLVEGHLNE